VRVKGSTPVSIKSIPGPTTPGTTSGRVEGGVTVLAIEREGTDIRTPNGWVEEEEIEYLPIGKVKLAEGLSDLLGL